MYLEEERDDKISTLLVTSTFLDGVALSALGLEIISSTFGIARWCLLKRNHFIALDLVIEDDIIYN